MEQQLLGMRLLKVLLPKEERHLLKDLPAQLDYMASTVDGFYALLGPRHWVFHDDLALDDMANLVADHVDDPEGAEQAFIAWYQDGDRLPRLVKRLHGHPGLRVRMHLLRWALEDYQAGRYYAVVQVLLSAMDGFVNDLDPANRRGLHTREPDEMDAWNSVVGHHQGLSAAHATFTKSFKARNDDPVYEVYRNGIVHGMLTTTTMSSSRPKPGIGSSPWRTGLAPLKRRRRRPRSRPTRPGERWPSNSGPTRRRTPRWRSSRPSC
ncbi:hypothetical protein [Serinicoccus hydrothermalis]|uniref:hypothetical protein n=1 Tax=Serinicoccus hydrothermalis TaxID=1758689 RepID=UPI0012FB9EA1|nr:hypothetical protein [Serinicoccus hydrothermalis]